MNNVKLSIFTGMEDTDIIELGLYNPSLSGIFNLSADVIDFSIFLEGNDAKTVSDQLEIMIADINNNASKYAPFQVSDLLAAKDYLTKLKIACDTYPACTVKIETL